MTAFERSAAPVPSETSSAALVGGKKHFETNSAHTPGNWQPTAGDASMYVSVAMGGAPVDAPSKTFNQNGTRKLSTKRMVKPPMEQLDRHARILAAQQLDATSAIDKRIGSFAGSFAGYARPQ
jgi:hypothetical protein